MLSISARSLGHLGIFFIIGLFPFAKVAIGVPYEGGSVGSKGSVSYSLIRHPIIVVEADVYVNRNKMVVRMRSLADDLELIQGVEALADGLYDPDEIFEATEDHSKYLAKHIVFRDGEGTVMKSELTDIVHVEIPEAGIMAGQLTGHKVEFEFEFKYETPPAFITLEHSMGVEGMLLPAELKVLMKQAGSDVPFTKMIKPSMPETFRFDWTRPALTQAASDKEWEEWFDAQREASMGLMQSSAVYSFLYINRFDVRHEVLIPIATLTTLLEIDRADPAFLEVAEQDLLIVKLQELFEQINPVVIDGIQVKPRFDRIDFFSLSISDLATQTERQRVSVANGRAGVIMSFSTKGSPTNVELTWDKFNHAILSVDTHVITKDKVEKKQFSKFLADNTYRWIAPESEPLPPITNVASKIDPDQYRPRKVTIPWGTAGLLAIGLISILAKPFFGSWKMAGISALFCLGLAPLLYPYFQHEYSNPFVKPAVFKIEDDEAGQIFAQLHKNMFRAMDYREESDIYDALAKSVHGDLLRDLYLKINQSLKMKEQGGTVARIDEVNLEQGSQQPAKLNEGEVGFAYRSRWNLHGTVEHWGHVHQRVNTYDADFMIKLVDDNWKIVKMDGFNEEPPTQIKTTLRKF